jgi:hypothetical protein
MRNVQEIRQVCFIEKTVCVHVELTLACDSSESQSLGFCRACLRCAGAVADTEVVGQLEDLLLDNCRRISIHTHNALIDGKLLQASCLWGYAVLCSDFPKLTGASV